MFITNIPPALVHDYESIGFAWGGRYGGQTDTMHFEYAMRPEDVQQDIDTANQIIRELKGVDSPTIPPKPSTPTTPTIPKDWFDMATAADLEAAMEKVFKRQQLFIKGAAPEGSADQPIFQTDRMFGGLLTKFESFDALSEAIEIGRRNGYEQLVWMGWEPGFQPLSSIDLIYTAEPVGHLSVFGSVAG